MRFIFIAYARTRICHGIAQSFILRGYRQGDMTVCCAGYRIINQNGDALKYSVLIHTVKRKRIIRQRNNKVEILLNRDRLETIITFNNNIFRLGIFKVFPAGFFYVCKCEKIIYHTAFIETALDDPEHISVDGYGEVLKEAAEEVIDQLKELIDSSDDGRIMKEGIQTVILGKPNAGKSSLLNILAGHDRAIVTDIEGTTRDVLEEQIRLQGLTLNIIDTAGIRQTDDIVEKMGVDKAKEYAKEADLIIYVVDASRNLDENDEKIFDLIYDKRTVILLNKSDLDTVVTEEMIRERISQKGVQKQIPVIAISAKEEQGIKELENTVKAMFLKGDLSFNEEVYITNARQKNALVNARESMKKVIFSIDAGMPEDFYSIDLMDAYESLGNITGESIGEDLVNEIFSKFCMGK